jgi:hypothetical protein
MIVEYDKERDAVYISKQIDNRWIHVGLNRDEVNQIIRSHPYNPQAEREKVLDETSNGVVLWSPAHIFRLICRLDETGLEYLLSDIRWLQERNFKRKHPELRQGKDGE